MIVMAKISLITGGSRSGKSRWAASYFEACDNVLYMCVPEEMDPDISERIRWSNEHHFVEWVIKKGFDINDPEIEMHKFYIFDDIATFTSKRINEMCPDVEAATPEIKKEIQRTIIDDISDLISRVQVNDGNMIIITFEPGYSVIPDNPQQRFFRDILSGVNQRIANISSEVYLSVSGIQFKIK